MLDVVCLTVYQRSWILYGHYLRRAVLQIYSDQRQTSRRLSWVRVCYLEVSHWSSVFSYRPGPSTSALPFHTAAIVYSPFPRRLRLIRLLRTATSHLTPVTQRWPCRDICDVGAARFRSSVTPPNSTSGELEGATREEPESVITLGKLEGATTGEEPEGATRGELEGATTGGEPEGATPRGELEGATPRGARRCYTAGSQKMLHRGES